MIDNDHFICLQCINDLPDTHFAMHADNPVEKIFWGRIPLVAAMTEFYFSKGSIIQNLIHEFKYRGNQNLALYLGKLMGESLLNSNRFPVDAIIPLPLFEKKEKKRGYNQAEVLSSGISQIMKVPVINKNLVRILPTETQTKKGRTERWENVEKTFSVTQPQPLEGKHLLLVDDVITTGATLEACTSEILKIKDVKISIAALAMATK